MDTPDSTGRVWTAADLAQELRNAGIRPGENLIVHSSFKSLGRVAGGPGAVVDAILEALGPEGNLLVPTFTYSLALWAMEPYDHLNSKARTGIIPDTVRRRAGAIRSFHPTHSAAAIGPAADELTRDHMDATPIGVDSPFGRMHRLGAKILMLGTTQNTNSSIHLCEVLANVPYLPVCFSDDDHDVAWYRGEEGQIEHAFIREVPGCSRGFGVVEEPLREVGLLCDVQVGEAKCQLLDLGRLVDGMKLILSHYPLVLLCRSASCRICTRRRRHCEPPAPA